MVDEGIRWTPTLEYCEWCANRAPQRMSIVERHRLHNNLWLYRCSDTSLCKWKDERTVNE